jgi:hypothetical protein
MDRTAQYRLAHAAFVACVLSLLAFCFLFATPVVGNVSALLVASMFDCPLSARGPETCLAFGVDIGPRLYGYILPASAILTPLIFLASFYGLVKKWVFASLLLLVLRSWLKNRAEGEAVPAAIDIAMEAAGATSRVPAAVVDARTRFHAPPWWLLLFGVLAVAMLWQREVVAEWMVAHTEQFLARRHEARVSRPVAGRPSLPVAVPMAGTSGPMPSQDARPSPTHAPIAVLEPLPAIQPLYRVEVEPSQLPPSPAGEAGLVDALRAGKLRPASDADFARWRTRYTAVNGRPPAADFGEHLRMMDAYLVQGDFVIPSGLHGAHAVVFLLDNGVAHPRGDPGHSIVLDLNSGGCLGTLCRVWLQGR